MKRPVFRSEAEDVVAKLNEAVIMELRPVDLLKQATVAPSIIEVGTCR